MPLLLDPPVYCCLDCPDLPETPLPEGGQVCCPGCGAVLVERLSDEVSDDGA